MDYQSKWDKICDYFENSKNKPEEYIQVLWEKLFTEIFGYSYLDGEIDSHRKIQLGSTERLIPDIIIKKDNSDLFMVELKREDLNITETNKRQLYSYLKQEHNDLGILICNKICIIDYDYNISDDEQRSCTINFEKGNRNGAEFIEIFEKRNFTKEKAKLFISKCIEVDSNIKEIKEQLNSNLIKQLLIDYFSKNCNKEEVEVILDKYTFDVHSKSDHQNLYNKMNISQCISNNYSSQRNSACPVGKTEQEKLQSDLKTVGKSTFINYFEYYIDPNCEIKELKELFRKNENWNENSIATKASTGKGIIKRGCAKLALEMILTNSSNVDRSLLDKAKDYLSKLS